VRIKVLMTDKAMQRETMDDRERMLSAALSQGVEVSVDCIKKGPDELDCHTDEAFAAPELVKMGIQAEKDGYDAIVIYCFSDVGLDALRENVRIPIIAPGETTLAAAQLLCNRFVVVTGESCNIPRTYRRLMKNAIAREKMATVVALDIPTAEMRVNPNATREHLEAVCKRAVEQYGADGVILGCLGMAGYGAQLEKAYPVKILDPAFIAVAYAELCVRLGLRHIPSQYPPFTNGSHVDL
jgi:allantoin racemase